MGARLRVAFVSRKFLHMISDTALSTVAAVCSAALALAALFIAKRYVSRWCFALGMALFSAGSMIGGLMFRATDPDEVAKLAHFLTIVDSLAPAVWLAFSLSYSRGNYREFLTRWRIPLFAAIVVPLIVLISFRGELLSVGRGDGSDGGWLIRMSTAAKVLHVVLLITAVAVLTNIEGTFRSAVGTMRWRIKFPVVGLAVIFGARIYTQSQMLLFSAHGLSLAVVDAGALIIGCALILAGYLRSGVPDIDVYPSHAVLRTSLTVLLAGGYLFLIGIAAQGIALFGGFEGFQNKALLVLVGVVVFAMLLLSDRLRQGMQRFVSRHLKRPEHDFRKVWSLFTQRMSQAVNQPALCTAAAKLLSETFNALSVTIWLVDEPKDRLISGASTLLLERDVSLIEKELEMSGGILAGLRKTGGPFDLETIKDDWGNALREASRVQFRAGGHRIGVPFLSGERCFGFAILADRVNGLPYSIEEMDLLKCIADQIAASLTNLKLTEDLMVGREMEAFQTMSAFFVHDLKNAASSLGLMLQNLPVHFNDPEFREDALRGMAGTVARINHLIERLGALRNNLDSKPVPSDLNELIEEVLSGLGGLRNVEIAKDLQPLPPVSVDREQIKSVITNLVLNSVDAVGSGGIISVRTESRNGSVSCTVSDNGCGMTAAFIRDSLFRPFQSTKKKGLGIGMFQSKMIVEAHRGKIQVDSESGKGTTFRVILPLQTQAP